MADGVMRVAGNLPGGTEKTRVTVDFEPQGQSTSWWDGPRVRLLDLGDVPGDDAPDEADALER